MNGLVTRLILILVIVESLLLVLPTSAIYIGGMFILVSGALTGHAGEFGFNTALFILTLFFLLPGYGLYSLWWLILKYGRIISFKLIPVHIYVGFVVGTISSIILSFPSRFSVPENHVTIIDQIKRKLYMGLGPLLVIATLMGIIYLQARSNKQSQQDSPGGSPLL